MTERTSYDTIAGGTPDLDEQHEARTVRRTDTDGTVYMMSEIGDGTFVQWSDCRTCRKRVGECGCAGGPVEPTYIERWRTERFKNSFTGRGVESALPTLLRTRDRRIDAVIRLLRSQGYTIEPPDGATETVAPASDTHRNVDDGLDNAIAAAKAAKSEEDAE
jgi:hypothetical protein